MSNDLLARFKQYRLSVCLERLRLSSVPADLLPLVKAYREALSRQLSDPENESWGSLGPNERHNALQEVYLAFAPKTECPKGNCPRCGGTGHIQAYSHVGGGTCLKCDGSGNVKPTLGGRWNGIKLTRHVGAGVLERYRAAPPRWRWGAGTVSSRPELIIAALSLGHWSLGQYQ